MDKRWMADWILHPIKRELLKPRTYDQLADKFDESDVDQFLANFDRYIDKETSPNGETLYSVDDLHWGVIEKYNSRLFPIFD